MVNGKWQSLYLQKDPSGEWMVDGGWRMVQSIAQGKEYKGEVHYRAGSD